jgi:transposase
VIEKMYYFVLSPSEEQELERTFKTTADRRLRARCQAVLMAARGRARHEIAQDLGVHRTTLRLWLRSYRERGLQGLSIQWAPGQPPRMPAALSPTIVTWVKGGPASCGLQRANWTYAELVTYLYQQTGIATSETAMREFCHRHQMRPYRPTYRYLRGNPQCQAQAQAELTELKKKHRRGSASC